MNRDSNKEWVLNVILWEWPWSYQVHSTRVVN